MTDQEHKLFVTPVSVADGMKRADGRTWFILMIAAILAIAVVLLINLFVEKPKVKWPDSPRPAATAPAEERDEPRTYDVAPPQSVPRPN